MNQAKVNTDTINSDKFGDRENHANHMVELAGEMFCPEGIEYQGSFTAHVYEKKDIFGNPTYAFANQILTAGMDEGAVDYALKTLRKDLMKTFGRVEKERK
jgi:hypothetical protein